MADGETLGVYLNAYQDGGEARAGLGQYFCFYDTERPHQTLGYRTPAEVFTSPVESLCEGVIESSASTNQRPAEPDLNLAPILSS